MLAVLLVAQLSHPPRRSGWLADDVILGVSFTILSIQKKNTKSVTTLCFLFFFAKCIPTSFSKHFSKQENQTKQWSHVVLNDAAIPQ